MKTTTTTILNILKKVLVWLPVQFIVIIILESLKILPSDWFLEKSKVYSGPTGDLFNYYYTIFCCIIGVLYTIAGCYIMERHDINTKKAWKWTALSFFTYLAVTTITLFAAKSIFPIKDYWFMLLDVWLAPILWLAEIEILHSFRKDNASTQKERSSVSNTIRNTIFWVVMGSLYLILGGSSIQFFSSLSHRKDAAKVAIAQMKTEEEALAKLVKKHGVKDEKKVAVQNVILMDMSGSMGHLRDVAISGANETIQSIRCASDTIPELKQSLTLSVFDGGPQGLRLNDITFGKPIAEVKNVTRNDYVPDGMTPLYDAIAETVFKVDSLVTPGTVVLMTIITDGLENASRKYTSAKLKVLIEKYMEAGWEFTYIGANQDAILEAGKMGINDAYNYDATKSGVNTMFKRENIRRGGRYEYYRGR